MLVSLKSKKPKLISMLSGLGLTVAASFTTSVSAGSGFVQNALLPNDAFVGPTCQQDIAKWFVGDRIIANGWVKPANGFAPIFADSAHNTKCDFYNWGAQMFLWLTSGTSTSHVFNTAPTFYNVSIAEQVTGPDGKPTSVRHFLAEDGVMNLALRAGKEDDQIELGQAGDNGVLLSQKESLVYYGVHANDVFAVYLTGQKNGAFDNDGSLKKDFPDTPQEVLDDVVKYGDSIGYPIPYENAQAMAMELKTSWVDAETVDDKSQYILTKAIVPTFDRSKSDSWPVNGTTEKTLALVGMHVVGTVNGHPEMIWSTFEHVNNAPNASYMYKTESNGINTVPYDSDAKDWIFMPKGGSEPKTVVASATAVNPNDNSTAVASITCNTKAPECDIAPVDVANLNPWGGLPADKSSADNNADLITVNRWVLGALAPGDIRGNYIQTGSIWTSNGSIPPGPTDSDLTGSLFIANTTMETFFQYPDQPTFQPRNCFGCHSIPAGSDGFDVSHIYGALQQLPSKK